jgi:acetylornithine deacetylase/succinyl-diaminopimelate desuccinylase-like protein
VPTALFGPGVPECAHVPDEYLEIGDYFAAAECYRALIQSYFCKDRRLL